MTEWQSATLGDFISVKHGYAFKGEFFAEDGDELVLTPGNFPVGGGLQFRPSKEKYYVGPYPDEFRLQAGDLLVVMTDLKQDAPILGNPAFVPDGRVLLHNQRLGLVQLDEDAPLHRRFLYYLLLDDSTRRQLRATATGSTVRHTAPGRICDVRVRVPPISTQEKIGGVLGTIDDLIENNRRRVDVLEEMARAIYREWFVHFRFPGHEDATFVASDLGPIPEGWRATQLGDVATLHYGKALKKADRRGGHVAVLGSSGVVGWHDESVVAGPVIVVGRKGNVGSITWVDGPAWPIDTTYFVETSLPLRYTCEHLRHVEFLNSHAAVPGLSRDQAYSRPFLVPEREIVERFEELADVLLLEATTLTKHAQSLTSARDLLLPKLVTGQIDVSSIDLDAVVDKAVV